MKFVILGFDGPDSQPKRLTHRPAHLAHLAPLDKAGRVILAGPLTDKTGSLIVLEADSREEIEQIVAKDPYVTGGVFERVVIHPFMQVFPETKP
ncbi:MAG: YciI family protein [Nitrospiraceae bacterium]